MPVQVQCPDCRAEFRVSEADLGRPGRCQKCGREMSLLATRDSDAPPAGDTNPVWTPPRAAELAAGETFGRYRILRRLGRGGMATVYLAHDSQLERDVALKVPRFTADESPDVVKRFTREARALARFDHPNICPVYDVGQIDGVPFLTMPHVEGKSLSELVTQPPLPQRTAAEVVRTLARALAEAHARGIIHRDLKPLNVLINARRKLVIMDFGLARRVEASDSRLTQAGTILGTPAYMAPEQVAGDLAAMGPGCDIYALGVILYELLTGRLPFEGPPTLVLGLVMVAEPPPPSGFRPDLDPKLESICLRAMAKKIPDRYPSMTALAEALDDYLRASRPEGPAPEMSRVRTDPPPGVAPAREPARPSLDGTVRPRPPSRWRRRVAVGLAALGVLGVIVWVTTDTGTVRIDVKDPGVVIRVDGREIQVEALGQLLTLRAGVHDLEVTHNNLVVETRKFEVRRHDQTVVEVSYEPVNSAPPVPGPAPEATDVPAAPPSPSTGPLAKVEREPIPEPAAPAPSESTLPHAPVSPPKELTNTLGMKLVLIPAGEFLMGSPDSDKDALTDEKPQHRVRITRPFYLGVHEVTQGQYRAVTGQSPSLYKGSDDLPVEQVSWNDAVGFCNALSAKEGLAPYYRVSGAEVSILGGLGYRLPTEAEWEHACRAGSTTKYSFGDVPAGLGQFAWFSDNSDRKTHPVGQKAPNAWGLYDMHGNVWEWCSDGYSADYYRQSPLDDPPGLLQASARVFRSGSWITSARFARSALRGRGTPEYRNDNLGFRLARVQSGK